VLAYYQMFANQVEAAKREKAIKRWTRKYKLKLIENFDLNEGSLLKNQ